MCRKFTVRGEELTLAQIKAKLEGRPHVEPKVVYSKQEVTSARTVLDRLAARTSQRSGVVPSTVRG